MSKDELRVRLAEAIIRGGGLVITPEIKKQFEGRLTVVTKNGHTIIISGGKLIGRKDGEAIATQEFNKILGEFPGMSCLYNPAIKKDGTLLV